MKILFFCGCDVELLLETIYSSANIYNLLLTCEEWMALRTYFNLKLILY